MSEVDEEESDFFESSFWEESSKSSDNSSIVSLDSSEKRKKEEKKKHDESPEHFKELKKGKSCSFEKKKLGIFTREASDREQIQKRKT